jgi:hypothetical protein
MRLDLGSQASQAVAKEPMLAGPAVPVLPQVRARASAMRPRAAQVQAKRPQAASVPLMRLLQAKPARAKQLLARMPMMRLRLEKQRRVVQPRARPTGPLEVERIAPLQAQAVASASQSVLQVQARFARHRN